MAFVRALPSHVNLGKFFVIVICITIFLAVFFSTLIASTSGRFGCPAWLIVIASNSELTCNATAYHNSKTQLVRRLQIFFDEEGGFNDSGKRPLCESQPVTLIGQHNVSLMVRSDEEIVADNPRVRLGGTHRPSECVPRYSFRLAVLVAFRDRQQHLQILLNNLHPFLQRQQLDYTIFVVEQAGNATFNRGKLFNVGYREAEKLYKFSCLVFHDVDLLPENDGNSYSCPQEPTLLSSAIEKNKYHPLYDDYLGGVVSFSSRHFRQINGFPNLYWGWGGEDDDLSRRVRTRIGKLRRAALDIGQYTMIKHEKDVEIR